MRYIIAALAALICLVFSPAALTATDENVHDCLVVIMDGSGSMNHEMPDPATVGSNVKMDVAKRVLLLVIPQVPENTQVGLLVFDGRGIRWAYPLGLLDRGMFKMAVDSIYADDNTPLGKSIEMAANRLMDEREKQLGRGSYKLLIVTDGEASDKDVMVRNTREVVARGIRVDTIGVAMDGGAEHSLAQLSNSYQAANDAVTLEISMRNLVVAEAGGKDSPVDFDLNGNLTPDVARVWVEALTRAPPNHPIGTQPLKPKTPQAEGTQSAQSPSAQQTGGCNTAVQSTGFVAVLLASLVLVIPRRRAVLAPVRTRR